MKNVSEKSQQFQFRRTKGKIGLKEKKMLDAMQKAEASILGSYKREGGPKKYGKMEDTVGDWSMKLQFSNVYVTKSWAKM